MQNNGDSMVFYWGYTGVAERTDSSLLMKSKPFETLQNCFEPSQDPSSIFALDAHIGELGCIERQMDTKIRPCLAGN